MKSVSRLLRSLLVDFGSRLLTISTGCLADTTAELLCTMSLTDAEGWILEHLSPSSEPSSPSRASADSPRVTSAERPFCLPERPNPPPRERVPPAMQLSNLPSRLGNPSRRFSTLKVTNLPRSITEAGLAAIYYWCDGFIDADLVGGRGYVKFESEQDARAALRAKKGTLGEVEYPLCTRPRPT